jgi:beta-glucanase (GH16 family)
LIIPYLYKSTIVKNPSMFILAIVLLAACSKGGSGSTSSGSGQPLGDLSIKAVVNPDSSGNVSFTASAANASSYDFDFGDGHLQTVPSGVVTYKYAASGSYSVNVVATGTGSQAKSVSTTVNVTLKSSGLIWADEFNTPGAPDPSKWTYDIGTGSNGWGNNELEYYTSRSSNVYVSNGTLKIVANKEAYNGSAYTSARMRTQGLYSFQYGRIDVSAKLPASMGTWPAIWMLGNNINTVGWPACGEIDIMEQNGQKSTIFGTLHYPTEKNPYGDGGSTTLSSASTGFHLYSAIWSAANIQLLVDNNVYFTLPNTGSIPFNQNFFILLNLAMGGNFGGAVDPAFTTDTLEIDYVRVYQ